MSLIIGIDPGLQHTGWGIIKTNGNALSYIASGVVHTNAGDSMPHRLKTIHDGLTLVIQKFMPIDAALEETYVNMNSQSSIKLSHARAAAMLTLSLNGLSVAEYPTRLIKKSVTGSGKAEKEQVIRMISLLMPGTNISNQDEADALATAICHSSFMNSQFKVV